MNNYETVCIDASLLIRLLITTDTTAPIHTLWRNWHSHHTAFVAPSLIFYEVCNVLHQYVRANQLTQTEATAALQVSYNLDITVVSDHHLHQTALAIAQQFTLPATYDAHYLALAKRLGISFWTADKKLYHTVTGKLNWIHLWLPA